MYDHATWEALKLYNYCLNTMAGGYPQVEHIDAIFVWGRAKGEWERSDRHTTVLQAAANCWGRLQAPIVIPSYYGRDHGQGETGYIGPDAWHAELEELGVPHEWVISCPGTGHNTKTEMEDFLELMIERTWQSAVAVTMQSHAMRAMLGTVRSLQKISRLDIKIYPVWPARFDLTQPIYGSQGIGPFSRKEWFDQEFDRIPLYTNQGDTASLQELKDYLSYLLQ